MAPLPYVIAKNFFLANYGAGQSVDNDDGSSYYDIRDNVMYAAGGLKSDYAGHDKQFHGNLNVGGGGCGMCKRGPLRLHGHGRAQGMSHAWMDGS